MNMKYASVTVAVPPGGGDPEVHVHGNMARWVLDQALDEAKKQIGTYEPTPLDRFSEETGIKVQVYGTHDPGVVRAFMEAPHRGEKDRWGLNLSSAEGTTPAEAQRNLARLISGKTLVHGAMLPNPTYVKVPDLTNGESPQGPGMPELSEEAERDPAEFSRKN